MNKSKFARLLLEISEKVESYPDDWNVDHLHIRMWKQRDALWITIPLIHNDKPAIDLNYCLVEAD